MNKCLFCKERTKNAFYCSRQCCGFNKRGKVKGDLSKTSNRHIAISTGKGKKEYLHRYLVEQLIRPLKKGEIVHHKDENKFNNEIENLEIVESREVHLFLHDYYRKGKHLQKAVTFENGW
jgi:HNH endonuclease